MKSAASSKRIRARSMLNKKPYNKGELPISGLVPFTTIDYPGHLSLVLFCQGCSWRCNYCHNSHLQSLHPEETMTYRWDEVVQLLEKRKGRLEAVVFSGGEPTLHEELPEAMRAVKELGFKVGLHTAGIFPDRLSALLPLVDWVGLDIKAPFDQYERITKVARSGAAAKKSAEILIASGIACEFRTTVHPSLLTSEEIESLGECLKKMGALHYVLQPFQPNGCKDATLVQQMGNIAFPPALCNKMEELFETFLVRQ